MEGEKSVTPSLLPSQIRLHTMFGCATYGYTNIVVWSNCFTQQFYHFYPKCYFQLMRHSLSFSLSRFLGPHSTLFWLLTFVIYLSIYLPPGTVLI